MTEETEVEFQLNVCGRYESEAVKLKEIQKKIREAIDSIASCDFVEVIYQHPELDDYEDEG